MLFLTTRRRFVTPIGALAQCAAAFRRDLRWSIHGRAVELQPFAIIDAYIKAPTGPATGISAQTLQVSGGLELGVSPMWQILGVTLPRIGVGYRAAGVLSGWYLAIGDQF